MRETSMQNDSFLEENSRKSGGALHYAMNKAAALDEEAREESHSPKTVLVQDLEKPQNCHHPFGLKNLSRSSSENSTFGNYPLIIKSLDDVIDSAEYLNEDAFQNCDFEYNLDVNFLNYHKYQEAAPTLAPMQATEHHHQFYSSSSSSSNHLYHQASSYSYDAHSLAQHMQVHHLKGKAIDAAGNHSTMVDYHHPHGTALAAVAYPSKTGFVGYPQDDFGTAALFPQHFQENIGYIGEGKVASYPAGVFSTGCGQTKKSKTSKRKSSSSAKARRSSRDESLLGGETGRATAKYQVKPLAKKTKVLQSQPGGTAAASSIRSNTTTTNKNNNNAAGGSGSKSARANSKKKRTSFPRNTTKALKEWLRRNILNPYPSEEEKKKLCREFDLTCPQLQTWFINARIRLWKPCIEHIYNSKKHQLKRMEANSSSGSGNCTSENPPSHSSNYLGGSPENNNLAKREIIAGNGNNSNSVSGAMKMISKLRAIPDLEIKIADQVEKFMASM